MIIKGMPHNVVKGWVHKKVEELSPSVLGAS